MSERNHGIDLLRIKAMFLVLILHILGQGGILFNVTQMSLQYEAAWFMEIASMCAVNCYAIVSGYVGIGSKYKYTNIILLWLRVIFYTLLITLFYSFFMPEAVSVRSWINAVFPVMKNQYWYFTGYFCLFFFIPVINSGINSMSKKQCSITVFVIIVLLSALQTVFSEVFITASGYSALWLAVLYVLGAALKKTEMLKKITPLFALFGYIFSVFLTWLVKYLVEAELVTFISDSNILFSYISPTIVFSAVFLLALFEKLKTGNISKKIIKVLSPLAFSVYLIHTHPLIWVNFMEERFISYASMPTMQMIVYVAVTAIIIYIICSAIDFIREGIFKLLRIKKILLKFEEKYIND